MNKPYKYQITELLRKAHKLTGGHIFDYKAFPENAQGDKEWAGRHWYDIDGFYEGCQVGGLYYVYGYKRDDTAAKGALAHPGSVLVLVPAREHIETHGIDEFVGEGIQATNDLRAWHELLDLPQPTV